MSNLIFAFLTISLLYLHAFLFQIAFSFNKPSWLSLTYFLFPSVVLFSVFAFIVSLFFHDLLIIYILYLTITLLFIFIKSIKLNLISKINTSWFSINEEITLTLKKNFYSILIIWLIISLTLLTKSFLGTSGDGFAHVAKIASITNTGVIPEIYTNINYQMSYSFLYYIFPSLIPRMFYSPNISYIFIFTVYTSFILLSIIILFSFVLNKLKFHEIIINFMILAIFINGGLAELYTGLIQFLKTNHLIGSLLGEIGHLEWAYSPGFNQISSGLTLVSFVPQHFVIVGIIFLIFLLLIDSRINFFLRSILLSLLITYAIGTSPFASLNMLISLFLFLIFIFLLKPLRIRFSYLLDRKFLLSSVIFTFIFLFRFLFLYSSRYSHIIIPNVSINEFLVLVISEFSIFIIIAYFFLIKSFLAKKGDVFPYFFFSFLFFYPFVIAIVQIQPRYNEFCMRGIIPTQLAIWILAGIFINNNLNRIKTNLYYRAISIILVLVFSLHFLIPVLEITYELQRFFLTFKLSRITTNISEKQRKDIFYLARKSEKNSVWIAIDRNLRIRDLFTTLGYRTNFIPIQETREEEQIYLKWKDLYYHTQYFNTDSRDEIIKTVTALNIKDRPVYIVIDETFYKNNFNNIKLYGEGNFEGKKMKIISFSSINKSHKTY